MRKLLFIAGVFVYTSSFGQGKTLWDVEMVRVKDGQSAAYEKAWKSHIVKFHNGDDKRFAEEIMSGSNGGNILIFTGPYALAELDQDKPNAAAHGSDFDMNVSPFIASFTQEGTYRWVDTLSYNSSMQAGKFITTNYHLKPGKGSDFRAEIKKALVINTKIKSPSSYNTYEKMWGGSSPSIVIVTHLKDGFKQLDNAFTPMTQDFKNAYIQEYGQAAWDKRQNLLPEIMTSWETYISKARGDLSSATK